MIRVSQAGKNTHPEASKALINGRYVDDVASSGNGCDSIIRKRDEIDNLIGQFGFRIKSWFSNKAESGYRCRIENRFRMYMEYQ